LKIKKHLSFNQLKTVVLPKKPSYQLWVENSLRAGAGLLALGALLDALSNAVALVTPLVTYIGTPIVFFSFVIIEVRLRRHPVPWITKDGQKILLTSVRHSSLRFYFLGMVLLLGLPRFFSYPKQQPELPISVAGQVRLDNRPLENATITIIGIAGRWTTDENGAFQFQIPTLVKSDSLTLTVRGKDGYAEIRRDTTVAANAAGALRLDLTTPPTQLIAGQVVEEGTGNPIADVQITLAVARGSGTTDSSGYFRFNALGKPFEAVDATLTHADYQTAAVGLTISGHHRLSMGRKK
jgi:hypothetical protein